MNYQKIYNQIIERAKTRQIEGYVEKHHIKPKCIGGINDKNNLVKLTAREHFLCHLLLVEIYPENLKLKQALWLMATNKNKKIKYKISSRTYERVKNDRIVWWGDKISKSNKGRSKPKGFGKKISKALKGIKRSEETKNKISKSSKGKIKHSEEFKTYISNVHKHKIVTNKTKNKISKSLTGLTRTLDTKQKMSISRKNVILTEERNDKISKSLTGKKKTKQHRKNLSVSKTGKPTSHHRTIIQYNIDGIYIKEWNKINEATVSLGKDKSNSSITQCCKGVTKTALGFIWRYKNN